MAEADTRSCESAVDIIAATAPEMNNPATIAGSNSFASSGIACSTSIFVK